MENFELQSLREVVKTYGPDVVKNFEEKFKEIRVEGKRQSFKDSVTNYTETPPQLTTWNLSRHRLNPCIWVRNPSLGKDLVIPGAVPRPKMADKGHCLKLRMVDQEPFPSLVMIILAPTGKEEDLQEEDRNSSIKIDQEHQQEVGLFLW